MNYVVPRSGLRGARKECTHATYPNWTTEKVHMKQCKIEEEDLREKVNPLHRSNAEYEMDNASV